jgi:hypothetical protein
MTRQLTALMTAVALVLGSSADLFAQRRPRGSVSAASAGSRTTRTKSGDTTTTQGQRATGTKTVSQTGDGYNVNKQVTTESGASKTVSKDVNVEDREAERTSTTTNKWGQSVERERSVEGQGGYATIEGKAETSSGREVETDLVADRNRYGQPAVAGSVDTKYSGNYNVAASRNPYGGWNTAAAGPYGGRVTRTLPSGYRTTTYYGRPYYSYGGAYYRPYMYRGVPYYYPVPVPYYAYYDSPPVGAIMLMVAGTAYLMSQDGSYSKKTTSSEGKVVYQSVPPPQGASLKTLPATRVLVTVSGTTYYLSANAFYRRVMDGNQETFVTVTPPAGVVFVQALPTDFEVVQLNTMYFTAKGKYYVPFLSSDGKELYVMVDTPPSPPASGGAASAPKAATPQTAGQPAAPAAPAAPVRAVAEAFTVKEGTLIIVRLASRGELGERPRRRSRAGLPRSGPGGRRTHGGAQGRPGLRCRLRGGRRRQDERTGEAQRDPDGPASGRQGAVGQDHAGERGGREGHRERRRSSAAPRSVPRLAPSRGAAKAPPGVPRSAPARAA